MNLEDALREVDTDRSKFGHGRLLYRGQQHPDYGDMRRREQELSTPSIEQLFAKLKHRPRKAAKRFAETVGDAIADSLDAVTLNEYSTYLVNAGYERT